MSHLSRRIAFAATLALAVPFALVAQESTDASYDDAHVTAELHHAAQLLAARHGPLAAQLFAENAERAARPHFLESRPIGSSIEPIEVDVHASHLLHYQAMHGSLGTLHGTAEHPVGVGWFPHSMFAQSGALYGRWGHALLLAAVDEHVRGEDD